jgi:hypothetical protein
VYFPNEAHPAFKATDAEVESWRDQGFCTTWIRRGKTSARLTQKASGTIARGESCKMGERVMIGNADGIPYFRSLVEGWRPSFA